MTIQSARRKRKTNQIVCFDQNYKIFIKQGWKKHTKNPKQQKGCQNEIEKNIRVKIGVAKGQTV